MVINLRLKDTEKAAVKLQAGGPLCADMVSVMAMQEKDLTLMSQKLKNIRYFDMAEPGQELTADYINNVLGLSAGMITDACKQLAAVQWTLRDGKTKAKAQKFLGKKGKDGKVIKKKK